MSWQDECLSTAAQAEDFLSRHLNALGLTVSDHAFTGRNIAYFSNNLPDRSAGRVLMCAFGGKEEELAIDRFRAEVRVKNLGSILFKALLGVACERSISSIFIHQVRTYGPAFWPSIGAVPDESPPDIGFHIDHFIEREKSRLERDTIHRLGAIKKIALNNRYLAWRVLSQSHFEFLGERQPFQNRLKLEIFKPLCEYQNLIILPGEPSTRAILERRLGALPLFPSTRLYPQVVKELAHAHIPADIAPSPAG